MQFPIRFTGAALITGLLLVPTAFAADDTSRATSTTTTTTTITTTSRSDDAKPCPWYRFGHCDNTQLQPVEGIPPDAPRTGTIITVDTSTNTLYLVRDGQIVAKSPAATGTGKTLRHGRTTWAFHTPRGHLRVLRRVVHPVWHKPDWAFVEAGKPIPPLNSKKREVRGHLGKYALDLGDGIMIHGTDDPESIGQYASHGCIRLPADMLQTVWDNTRVGTDVYVFDSNPQVASRPVSGPEHHSDLDYQGSRN